MADKGTEPVHLLEDETTGNRFLVYATDKGLRLDIRYQNETLWMTQAQIGELFGVTVATISRHIANIVDEGELSPEATITKIETVRLEGKRQVTRTIEYYNLDMIISVGYRVSSAQATLFRRWATGVLVQFATKSFVVDAPRLKQPDNFDRIKELREIIRDLRSDEANLYRELRNICAMCQDYDHSQQQARDFYQKMQAKLIYAVTSHTPAEVVYLRADSAAQDMGLQTWPNDNIRKGDVITSKNYLAEREIKELNRLTTILLDIFEDQLELGRLVVMQDAIDLFDRQMEELGRAVLRGGGHISTQKAKHKAETEYVKFDERRKIARHQAADENIAALTAEVKKLPKARKT